VASKVVVHVHFVWSTWHRRPMLTGPLEAIVHEAIAAGCIKEQCAALAVGGMPDHVHVLVRLSQTVSLARLAGVLKGTSSSVARSMEPDRPFRWQRGYAAFSVSPEDVPEVEAYIHNQKSHHAGGALLPAIEESVDD
jgi:putative transposase